MIYSCLAIIAVFLFCFLFLVKQGPGTFNKQTQIKCLQMRQRQVIETQILQALKIIQYIMITQGCSTLIFDRDFSKSWMSRAVAFSDFTDFFENLDLGVNTVFSFFLFLFDFKEEIILCHEIIVDFNLFKL